MGLFDIFRRPAFAPRDTQNDQRENESWIVRRGGEVIEKKSKNGEESLTDWEHIVYYLWLADYMMRNAGDFANAADMCPNFQTDAASLAKRLGLVETQKAFSLSERMLQREYFARFDVICSEIRGMDPEKNLGQGAK